MADSCVTEAVRWAASKGLYTVDVPDILRFATETNSARRIVETIAADRRDNCLFSWVADAERLSPEIIDMICRRFAERVQNVLDFNEAF